jgi:hypothetical protein
MYQLDHRNIFHTLVTREPCGERAGTLFEVVERSLDHYIMCGEINLQWAHCKTLEAYFAPRFSRYYSTWI